MARAPGENLKIDGQRLWDSLMKMAKIGPGIAGGNNRQTLTDEDAEGRALFAKWCEEAGCEMGLDQMGNMFATRAGTDPEALPVYVGSHLDTQPTGGKYDGVLGVLGGLEIVRSLNDLGIETKHPIVVTNFTNEEGTRFAPAMLSSGVFAGLHEQDWAYARTDAKGATFGDELQRIGWKGEEEVGARRMHAFFELHIEQGPILEAEGKEIGVVTHGQGLSWTQVTITGKDSHTGSTPMPMRRDAGLGMARVLMLVNEIALGHAPHAVGAAGHIDVHPNSRNVIPGKVVFTVDLRSPDLAVIEDMEARLKSGAEAICDEMGLEVAFEKVGGFDPVTFDETCVSAVRNAAERLGHSHMNLISGAGHDACWINRVAPTAMVMCPCVDGLSHNEAEEISPDWAAAGTNVLFHAVVEDSGDRSLIRMMVLALTLGLAACSTPESNIRPGIGSDADLDRLRPPSGTTYRFAYEQDGEATPGVMVLTSRRLGPKSYSYRGNFIVDVAGAGNLEEGVRSVAELFETPGIRAEGSRVFVPVRIDTDNRFRTTSSVILKGRDVQAPHDCFAVLGECQYNLTTRGQTVTIGSTTTESGGIWRTEQRVISKNAPLAIRLRREIWTYSLDKNGVMIDLFITRKGAGPNETTGFRRKTQGSPS